MDEAVVKYYRNLLRTGFEHAGTLENPSIFLDTVGEKVTLCGSTGDFMQLFVKVEENRIADIKYNCCCDPNANVAVEILCILASGKTLDEASNLKEKAFFEFLGTSAEEFRKKVRGLLDLLILGIHRYKIKDEGTNL